VRDSIQLNGLIIKKNDQDYKIHDFYSTQLGKLYIKVENLKTKESINYEFLDLISFLTKNQFSLKNKTINNVIP